MMKRFALAAVAALLLVSGLGDVFAANQQVDPNTWRKGAAGPFYGRDDGLVWHKTYKSPRLIGNGDGYMPLGPTYYEDFSAGDGLGVVCESVARTGSTGFTVAAGADAACNTTCGVDACVSGFEGSLDAAADILACSDATADACICQKTSADQMLDGCGANWEASALSISLLSFQSGVRLAHVSLLQQDIGPDMDASGLDIAGDQTNNDGAELLGGLYGASGRPMYPGVDPAFQLCVTVDVTDIDGTDTFYVGWRDLTAPNATFASYNSYFVVGHNAGDTVTLSEDDGGGTTTTDLNDSDLSDDSGFVKYCALVSDAGVATPAIGAMTCNSSGQSCTGSVSTPSNAASYTFDSGTPLLPIVHFLHDTNVADEIVITEWEVSYQ